ncbi:MAG TPA: calcium-binding protein [Allosphingosinicella sp.]|jgi:Ca2+-binding RTX toxin-like protein
MAIIVGTSDAETLTGTASADEIYGLDGDDTLVGGDGDDLLDGGAGGDAMAGGTGDDIYVIDLDTDSVIENADEGVDTIVSGAGYTLLPDYVENLTGTSADYQQLIGNALDNVITGGAGWNFIYGDAGDDTIVHSTGGDAVSGGEGWDTYVLPGSAGDYEITLDEWGLRIHDLGDGGDTFLYGVEEIRFDADAASVTVDALFNRYGTAGDDTLEGNDSDNLIYGYGGSDTLIGHGGRDILDGGAGADVMIGGDGMDDYYVDDAADVVIEAVGGGWDQVLVSTAHYTIGDNIEVLATSLDVDSVLIGNNGDNSIFGGGGSDRLEGRGGDDYLDGGAGGDVMVGGSGNDTYWVNDSGDTVVEAAGCGTDTVQTNLAAYTLPAFVENLFAYSSETLNGNGLNNVITVGPGAVTVDGKAGNDTLSYAAEDEAVLVDLQTGEQSGGAADDVLISIENLTGTWADDELRGNAGANILDGGYGADMLVGRGGNDVYLVDNEGDVVVELAGQGLDEVRTTLAAYALPDDVEKLKFIGEGDFTGTGNVLNNDITGGIGNDQLYAGDGNDSLYGGAGDDQLFGEAGHDMLSGGTGADAMAGGDGNDVYIVDNVGDVVTELADQGVDQVYASTAAFTLSDNVENLSYNGSSAFHGIGNALANVIYGGGGSDVLEGNGGADELRGGSGGDSLSGGDGGDLLVGGSGADVMTGGAGADLFRISGWESGLGSGADRIADFVQGEDLIDLSGMDANIFAAGDQAFSFIGTGAFTGGGAELRYAFDGTDTWIQGDINGDGIADFEIALTGQVPLVTTDFLL